MYNNSSVIYWQMALFATFATVVESFRFDLFLSWIIVQMLFANIYSRYQDEDVLYEVLFNLISRMRS